MGNTPSSAAWHKDYPPASLLDIATVSDHHSKRKDIAAWFETNFPTFPAWEGTVRQSDLLKLSVDAYIEMRKAGMVTCVEYAETFLSRAFHFKGLNCFTVASYARMGEWVVKQAKVLDDKVVTASGDTSVIAPLYGLPVAIKDTLCTEGFPTGFGTGVLADFIPSKDAAMVAILKRNNAVMFGKVTTPPWALSWVTSSFANGITRNPHDPKRAYVGGSSGGTGSAVAARCAPIGVTEDTGGSTRHPANTCGVFGYDPPKEKYPNDGNSAITTSNDQLGLHGTSFDDILILDAVITGKMEAHAATKLKVEAGSGKIRVAFPTEFFVNFNLPTNVEEQNKAGDLDARGLPQHARFGELRSCRASWRIRERLAKVKVVLSEDPKFEVVNEEFTEIDSPALGKCCSLYHAMAGFDYAEGKYLNPIAVSCHPLRWYTEAIVREFGPQPPHHRRETIFEIIADCHRSNLADGSFAHCPGKPLEFLGPAHGASEDLQYRALLGPYMDFTTEIWNQYFDAHQVDLIVSPPQFMDTPSMAQVAGGTVPLEIKDPTTGEYLEKEGYHVYASNAPHYFWPTKFVAMPKVAVPLGVDDLGRPLGLVCYGRAVPRAKVYDREFIQGFDLDFLYQVREVVRAIHTDATDLKPVAPALGDSIFAEGSKL